MAWKLQMRKDTENSVDSRVEISNLEDGSYNLVFNGKTIVDEGSNVSFPLFSVLKKDKDMGETAIRVDRSLPERVLKSAKTLASEYLLVIKDGKHVLRKKK